MTDRRGGAGEFTTEVPEAPVECERADDQDAPDGGPDGPRHPRAEAARVPAERERAEDPTHGRHALARPPLPFRSPSTRTVASNRQGRPDGVRRRPLWPPPSADEPGARTRVPARTHPSAALLSWQSLESHRRPPDGRDGDGCPGGHRRARRRARPRQNVRSAESTQNRPRPFTHLS